MSHQRVALVPGANRGLGREICRQLASRSRTVIVAASNSEKGVAAAAELAAGGTAVTSLLLDVPSAESIRDVVAWVAREYGKLDVLVNKAGIFIDG